MKFDDFDKEMRIYEESLDQNSSIGKSLRFGRRVCQIRKSDPVCNLADATAKLI